MAVKQKAEIIAAVKEVLGDRQDDVAIALLEDISDSYPDVSVDWQKKLDDLDAEWRGRYMERFNEPINTGAAGSNGGEDQSNVDTGGNDDVVDDVNDTEDELIDDLFVELDDDDKEGD